MASLIGNADIIEGPEAVRPLHFLVSAAIDRFNELLPLAKEAISGVAVHVGEELERRARLEEVLSGMNAEDAVLVRNYFAKACGEQRLSVERLMVGHSLLFEGRKRNTLDQRLKRKLHALRKGEEGSRQRKPCLMDVLQNQMEGQP